MKKVRPQDLGVYLPVIKLIEQNKSPSQISRILNISKQNLNNHLRRLVKNKKIIKKSRGIYKVNSSPEHPSKLFPKEIRGHAFIWTLKLNRKWDWINRLNKFKQTYKLVRNTIPRIIINNRKIWLGKENIVIYEAHSFYGKTAAESKRHAVISLLETINKLEFKLNINLKPYIFKPAREHYGIIKNDLAQQCNRQGEKIHVYDNLEGEWLWIDDSLSLGELETGGKKALLRNLQAQKYFNSHKKTDFKVTPEFVLNTLTKIAETQLHNQFQVQQFTKQIKSHLKLIKDYRRENKAWRKNLEKQYTRKETKDQTSLKRFI